MTALGKTSATWDVVVTVRASHGYVARFIETFRTLGATRIHLYYDDAAHSVAFEGGDLTQTVCGPDHWQGKPPRAVEKRQIHNAGLAAAASTSDWILHCDIDEHLAPLRAVSDILADLPDTCGCYIVLPGEAVYPRRPETIDDIFATACFKSLRPGWHANRSFWQGVYGDLIDLTMAGYWGHRVGKSFIRRSHLVHLLNMPIHMLSGPALAHLLRCGRPRSCFCTSMPSCPPTGSRNTPIASRAASAPSGPEKSAIASRNWSPPPVAPAAQPARSRFTTACLSSRTRRFGSVSPPAPSCPPTAPAADPRSPARCACPSS